MQTKVDVLIYQYTSYILINKIYKENTMIIKIPFKKFLFWDVRCFSFWPIIALRKNLDTKSDIGQAMIRHEKVHYNRQALWSLLWIILYFSSKKFRWQEEKLAYKEEIQYLQFKNIDIDYINILSTKYWNMCTKKEAKSLFIH